MLTENTLYGSENAMLHYYGPAFFLGHGGEPACTVMERIRVAQAARCNAKVGAQLPVVKGKTYSDVKASAQMLQKAFCQPGTMCSPQHTAGRVEKCIDCGKIE